MKQLSTLFACTFLMIGIPELAQAARQSVCINQDTGAISVKRRCKANRNEVKASLETLKGEKGDPGDGSGMTKVANTEFRSVASLESTLTVFADCPTGSAALGGTCSEDTGLLSLQDDLQSKMSRDGRSWGCVFQNIDSGQINSNVTATVICAAIPE